MDRREMFETLWKDANQAHARAIEGIRAIFHEFAGELPETEGTTDPMLVRKTKKGKKGNWGGARKRKGSEAEPATEKAGDKTKCPAWHKPCEKCGGFFKKKDMMDVEGNGGVIEYFCKECFSKEE